MGQALYTIVVFVKDLGIHIWYLKCQHCYVELKRYYQKILHKGTRTLADILLLESKERSCVRAITNI